MPVFLLGLCLLVKISKVRLYIWIMLISMHIFYIQAHFPATGQFYEMKTLVKYCWCCLAESSIITSSKPTCNPSPYRDLITICALLSLFFLATRGQRSRSGVWVQGLNLRLTVSGARRPAVHSAVPRLGKVCAQSQCK